MKCVSVNRANAEKSYQFRGLQNDPTKQIFLVHSSSALSYI